MKTLLKTVLAFTAILTINTTSAQEIRMLTSDDAISAPLKRKPTPGMNNLQPIPMIGEDAVIWATEPEIGAPETPEVRANVIGGMFHANVPTDRLVNHAAWSRISTSQPEGFQWFDFLSTTNIPFWMGAKSGTNFGHRLILSVQGTSPVNAYEITVTCSITNVAPMTFNVATNTASNTEIAANPQHVLVYNGTNGTNESHFNTLTGRVMPGGDDGVFDNGQLPSAVIYSTFTRFGSTFVIYCGTEDEIEAIRRQFTQNGPHWFKATLRKNGAVVAESYIEAAMANVVLEKTPDPARLQLRITDGQLASPYAFESKTNIYGGTWTPFIPGNVANSGGAPISFPQDWAHKRFIRAVAQ